MPRQDAQKAHIFGHITNSWLRRSLALVVDNVFAAELGLLGSIGLVCGRVLLSLRKNFTHHFVVDFVGLHAHVRRVDVVIRDTHGLHHVLSHVRHPLVIRCVIHSCSYLLHCFAALHEGRSHAQLVRVAEVDRRDTCLPGLRTFLSRFASGIMLVTIE